MGSNISSFLCIDCYNIFAFVRETSKRIDPLILSLMTDEQHAYEEVKVKLEILDNISIRS